MFLKIELPQELATSGALKFLESCDLLDNILYLFCGDFQNVFLLLCITFTSNLLAATLKIFTWKFHTIIIDKYPVSSSKFFFQIYLL